MNWLSKKSCIDLIKTTIKTRRGKNNYFGSKISKNINVMIKRYYRSVFMQINVKDKSEEENERRSGFKKIIRW